MAQRALRQLRDSSGLDSEGNKEEEMRSLAPQRLRAEAGCSRLPPVALGEVGLLAGGGSSRGSVAPGSTVPWCWGN